MILDEDTLDEHEITETVVIGLASVETAAERETRLARRTRRDPVKPESGETSYDIPKQLDSATPGHPEFTEDVSIAQCPKCKRAKYARPSLWERGTPVCKTCRVAMVELPPRRR